MHIAGESGSAEFLYADVVVLKAVTSSIPFLRSYIQEPYLVFLYGIYSWSFAPATSINYACGRSRFRSGHKQKTIH